MSLVDEIKQRVDIVDLVSESVPLRKAGRNYKGLCPFHQEKTPSFVVFPDTQSWHCFGSCGEGGDVLGFVQKREGVAFGEALRVLAQRAGVRLRPESEEAAQEAEERDRLQTILEAAADYYSEQLATATGEVARTYLAKRGVGQGVAAEFRLGYSPNAWRALSTRLMASGYSRQELAEAGLIVEKEEEGSFYDRFRHRLMFPIADGRGHVLGFGARSLDGSEPKYLNSPQTRLFDKGKLLYGLHLARQAVISTETAVIVEGYMDVIAAHEAGYHNVVASMGTAISEAQLQSLARAARRFVLALDADSAGNAAALRGLAVATEALQGEATPSFEGGLLRFEQRLNAEIRVAVLPEGLDPDDLIRRDPSAWEKLTAEAESLVDYYFAAALAEEDLGDAKSKGRFARRLLPVLASLHDPFERAHHVARLARHLKVEAGVVERELAAMRGVGGEAGKRRPKPVPEKAVDPFGLEEYALRFLLHRQDALGSVDKALANAGLGALAAADFLDAANRSLFLALRERGSGDRLAFRAALGPDLRQIFDRIEGSWATAPEADEQFWWRDGITSALRLREKRFKSELRLLQLAMQDGDEPGEQTEFRHAVERTRRQLDLLMEMLAGRSLLRAGE